MNTLGSKKVCLGVAVAVAVLMLSVTVGIALLAGCAGNVKQSSKPGAQLWGENCGRCHNIRPITSLEDPYWEVVGLHMQTRARLTGDEANKIVEFLKASN